MTVGQLPWEQGVEHRRRQTDQWQRLFACYQLTCDPCDVTIHSDYPNVNVGVGRAKVRCPHCNRAAVDTGRHWHLAGN